MKYENSFLHKLWFIQIAALSLLVSCNKSSDNNNGSTSPGKSEKSPAKTSNKETGKNKSAKTSSQKDSSVSPPKKGNKKCIYKLNPNSHNSYLQEIRSKHNVPLRDFQKKFPAKPFTAKAQAFKHTKDYTFEGEPLFFFDPTAKKAVVNNKVFSDLKLGNPPRFGKKKINLGTIKTQALKKLEPAKIAKFLLQAQIILTYAHIEAKLCARNEKKQKNGDYEISFKAKSIYYTNRKNVSHYGFKIKISNKGAISIKSINWTKL